MDHKRILAVRRLLSLRVQQTALFAVVVLVAVAVLSAWILGALSAGIADSVRSRQLKDAAGIADVLGAYFPSTASNRGELRSYVRQFGDDFGDDIRVYDLGGTPIESRQSVSVPSSVLSAARKAAAESAAPYARVDLGDRGLAIAAAPVLDRDGRKVAVVVLTNRATEARGTLAAARSRLEIAALVTLVASGLIGFAFSDFIARQARRLVSAADDIAAGDFSRRLPRGPFPGEIRELAEAFNRMAEQLGEAFETLKGQEQAQRQFVANASHELRTPIAALKGAIEILETGGKDKPSVRDEFLATMRIEANRLQRLVDNLFTLAQVDSGRLHMQFERVPADEIAWVVTTAMRPLANDAGVALEAEVPAEDLVVLADRDRITQVLLGFVDNAVKHSHPGGVVTVSLCDGTGRVRFAVSDTGSGIPADVLPQIFDRFFTQRKHAEGQRKGSGLGLAIASEIVEAHGSLIEVATEEGRGSTFSFELPRPDALA